jgi:hypothetical protein
MDKEKSRSRTMVNCVLFNTFRLFNTPSIQNIQHFRKALMCAQSCDRYFVCAGWLPVVPFLTGK